MYSLLLEIPYVSLLLSIEDDKDDRDSFPELLETLHNTLNTSFLISHTEWSEYMLFIYDPPDSIALLQLLKIIQDIQEHIHSRQDTLPGYALYLDRCETKEAGHIIQAIHSYIDIVDLQDGLRISSSAWPDFSSQLVGKLESQWYLVERYKLQNGRPLPTMMQFMRNETSISHIKREIDERRSGKVATTHPLIIRFPISAGISANVRMALKEHVTKEELYLQMWNAGPYSDYLMPLINSIGPAIIQKISTQLSEKEKRRYAQYKQIIDSLLVTADYYTGYKQFMYDFLSLYRLILIGFCRLACAQNITPIIFLEDAHQFSKRTLEIIADLYQSNAAQYGAILIVGCQRLPRYFTTYFSRYTLCRMNPHSPQRIQKYLADIQVSEGKRQRILQYHTNPNLLFYNALLDHLQGGSDNVSKEKPPGTIIELTKKIIQHLLPVEYDLLLTISLMEPHYSTAIAIEVMIAIGYSAQQLNLALKRLAAMGFIRSGHRCHFCRNEIRKSLSDIEGENKREVYRNISNQTYLQWKAGAIPLSPNLQKIVGYNQCVERSLEIAFLLISHFSIRNDITSLDRLLDRDMPLIPTLADPLHLDSLQVLLCAGRIRLAILKNDVSQASAFMKACECRQGGELGHGHLEIERARYYCMTGKYQRAIQCTVNAILVYQEHSFEPGILLAHTDCGYYHIMINQLIDAKHHLEIGAQDARETDILVDLQRIRNGMLQVVLQFIIGNYSQVEMLVTNLTKQQPYSASEWLFYMYFMKARALFELGLYTKAFNEFQHGYQRCAAHSHQLAMNLFNLWLGRTLIYLGKPQEALEHLKKCWRKKEYHYYAAEAYVYNAEYPSAISHIETALRSHSEPSRLSMDNPDWSHGYSYIYNGQDILNHQIQALHGYLMGKIGKNAHAIKVLRQLIKLERIDYTDPYISIYYFFFSQILNSNEEQGSKFQQLLLGRSLKFMHERSQYITDNNDRAHYLNSNYWNQQLIYQAHIHRMI